MKDYYSTLSGWLIPFSRAMQLHGLDVEECFGKFNIDPHNLVDQESRLATDKLCKLALYCNQQLNRQDFTIEIAKQFHPGMFHALGYAMMSSNTLFEALERIERYKRVVSNTCTLELYYIEDQLIFETKLTCYEDSGRPVLDWAMLEVFLGTIVQFSRELVKPDVNPLALNVTMAPPPYDIQHLKDFFGCDINFNQPDISLVFSREVAETKLIGGNPVITRMHEKMLDELLSRIDRTDLTYQIKNKIYDDLPMGAPSQTEIAMHLGMSLRNLQRKLNEKGTSYKDILECTRKKLALEYIRQQHLSLSEIGYLVGFSSVGNFNRAFKRWTQQTPGEYRTNLNLENLVS